MRILIITGGRFDEEFATSYLQKNKYDSVIAVDNGLTYAQKLNITPDIVVGDFDTFGIENIQKNVDITRTKVLAVNPEKDDTDTELAINTAIRIGSTSIDIICATGNRFDHTLGNLHNLYLCLNAGVDARIVDSNNTIRLIKAGNTILKQSELRGKYVSLIPFAGNVIGVTLKGFKYPLDNYTIEPGYSIGISNELVESEGTITIGSGVLILVNSND